jgi:hypothetical protein
MFFDDRLLFLHVPKAAGMSITQWLVEHAKPGAVVTGPPSTAPQTMLGRVRRSAKTALQAMGLRPGGRARRVEGRRHATLTEAREDLAAFGRRLEDFERIVAVMRNPYHLEISYYNHLRSGRAVTRSGPAFSLAQAGDFAGFAERAPFFGRLPARIEDWYAIDGNIPANLAMVRFEHLAAEIGAALGMADRVSLPTLNASGQAPGRNFLTAQSEAAVYRKFRWLFDRGFYRREIEFTDSSRISADLS